MSDAPSQLDLTGERMLPDRSDPQNYWEHVLRYRFAAKHARGKRVLDIACGEGYGTRGLMEAGAAFVLGIDRSDQTARHAHAKYGVPTLAADAQAIPLRNGSIDLIVSFETIEHVPEPGRFLDECRRVLTPGGGGTLIVSTPNKALYSPQGTWNPYHAHEMDEREFTESLRQRFASVELFSQTVSANRWWSPHVFRSDRAVWRRLLRAAIWRESLWRWPGSRAIRPRLWSLVGAPALTDVARDRTPQMIARGGGSALSPYAVRPQSKWERGKYLIAVARV
jgi:ubiquinone/menaquinone biosynthesis C-methylase UbiE